MSGAVRVGHPVAGKSGGPPRVFTASLATETNTFSPLPTDLDSFRSAFHASPGTHPDTPTLCSSPVPILRRRGAAEGFTVIEGSSSWAEPGGPIRRDVFERLRDDILSQLRAALPVDAVVLGLHGAMVARGYDDCEGDLLERVREIVGPDVLVASEFDPHSHLTAKRVAQLDIAAAFLEYPHTDFAERGEHVVELALQALRGEIVPRLSTFDCRMIDLYPTSREPMRSFVDRARALEGRNGILSVSIIHGFMAGDVPEMGTRILVVSDGRQADGDALARRLGLELYALRGTTAMSILPLEQGLDTASAVRTAHPDRPVTVSDIWDNPGGGCAGDGTHVLRAMMRRDIGRVGVAALWDPLAVALCHAAGEGARLPLRFGGKVAVEPGAPIDAEVEVVRVAEESWQSFRRSRVTLGRSAVVRPVGSEIDIILISARTQTYEPDIFTNLGIDPMAKDFLLVKSTNHFHAGFAPISSEIIYVDAPSNFPTDPRTTRYRKMRRAIWPLVDDPMAGAVEAGDAAESATEGGAA